VTITNNDSAGHTFTADDGSFSTGKIDPGASATITFDTAGTFAYHCDFHSSMKGSITVT
jgi:plastocyanin